MAADKRCNAAIIEAAPERFFQAPTIEEAREALAPLSPQERWALGIGSRLPQCINATPVAYFRLCDETETSQEDMETLYRGIFRAISGAIQQSKEQKSRYEY